MVMLSAMAIPPSRRTLRPYNGQRAAYDRDVVEVPVPLVERARAFLANPGEVAVPRHAATVVLLRDAPGGTEVYLLRRAGTMAFAAGMHVFPGGSVDPRDGEQETAWAGPPPGEWAQRLGCDEALARALVCAAVRETFEESGVLLAGTSAADVVADTTAPDWERDRAALLDRSLSMAQLLTARGLVLRSDLMRAWAHWITPEFEPRRFDTRFFVAALPAGQLARDVSGEADHADWLPVREAVAAHEAGRLAMLPPTIEAIREVAALGDVAAVLASPRDVRPQLPRLVDVDGVLRLEVP
jgi:8-oxo-dGTP pyrophosphatase MutT (NUDIX family)